VLQSFYASDKWRTFRAGLIAERGNRCQMCGNIIARANDIIGHHKIELTPENVHDHTISLNPEKVDLICSDCHNEEHNRFGYHTKKNVFIVYGPPMAGKKTHVRQQMKRGDLIVDMDHLFEAVSWMPAFNKPDNLFSNVMSIHNTLIDHIRTRLGKWGNAWIIGGYADKYKREKLADELGAELVFCDTGREECLARLATSEQLRYRQAEWRQYIDKWFEQYQE
jgi:predicted kinase